MRSLIPGGAYRSVLTDVHIILLACSTYRRRRLLLRNEPQRTGGYHTAGVRTTRRVPTVTDTRHHTPMRTTARADYYP